MNLRTLLKPLLTLITFLSVSSIFGQHAMEIDVVLNVEENTLTIQQRVDYQNNSEDRLSDLYFNDWISSFSGPTTPLAERFVEEFNGALLAVKVKDRGFTDIITIQNSENHSLNYTYLDKHQDILKVTLDSALEPNASTTLYFEYTLQIQNDKFTGYGVNKDGDYNLNYWYLSPAVYEDSQWIVKANQRQHLD